jgi:DNA repair photolyase
VVVNISVTTLDGELAKVLRAARLSAGRRLAAIEALSSAGVPVRVLMAPMIPGLNDHEMPAILAAVAAAGACDAHYVPLRLPWAVAPLFEDWLDRHRPARRRRCSARAVAPRRAPKMIHALAHAFVARGSIGTAEGALRSRFAQARFRGTAPELSTAAFRVPTIDKLTNPWSLHNFSYSTYHI